MSILYLLTSPPPPIQGTDAVYQEVAALRGAFKGEIVNLSPINTSTRRFPKQLFGFHNILTIRKLEKQSRINHLFFTFPYAFPVLHLLRNPILFTVTASLDVKKKPPVTERLQKLERVIVSNERDADILKAWGLTNYTIIPPGIDTANVVPSALPLGRELTLLMASAPWISRQFDTKGIDLLLETAAKLPFLRLILLWRGVLADELKQRVERFDLGKRVEIVNHKVDISDYLKRAHAAVLLVKDGGLVKSFPHSLFESLVAGKPVLISDTIAMADFVSNRQCGIVVTEMTIAALVLAIERLRHNYGHLIRNAAQMGSSEFSVEKMVEKYRQLYETLPN